MREKEVRSDRDNETMCMNPLFHAAQHHRRPQQQNLDASPKKKLQKKLQVEVLFVRHGQACPGEQVKDPRLTDCGVKTSEANGKELNKALRKTLEKFDRVQNKRAKSKVKWTPVWFGSSAMMRSMETALLMFPDAAVVHPLPFISEKDGKFREKAPCDIAMPEDEQHKKFTPEQLGRLSWEHVRAEIHSKNQVWKAEDARSAGKYKQFRSYLGHHVVPDLLDKTVRAEDPFNNENEDVDKVLRLVVVSHASFIEASLKHWHGISQQEWHGTAGCQAHYVKETVAMLVTYDYDDDEKSLTEARPSTETALIFDQLEKQRGRLTNCLPLLKAGPSCEQLLKDDSKRC